MNYISELNAFYERIMINSLPAPVISLWHALMSVANKTGWQEEFTVSVSTLALRAGLNEKAVARARTRLEREGYIKWRSRKGNQSAVYQMVSLVRGVPQCDSQNVPIIKQRHKQNNNTPPISPIERFGDFCAAYPKAVKNLQATEIAYCKLLFDDQNLEECELVTAAKNYTDAVCALGTDEHFVKNAENFLRDGTFVQYLDGNYRRPDCPVNRKNQFNNFQQNEYDITELERELLRN